MFIFLRGFSGKKVIFFVGTAPWRVSAGVYGQPVDGEKAAAGSPGPGASARTSSWQLGTQARLGLDHEGALLGSKVSMEESVASFNVLFARAFEQATELRRVVPEFAELTAGLCPASARAQTVAARA